MADAVGEIGRRDRGRGRSTAAGCTAARCWWRRARRRSRACTRASSAGARSAWARTTCACSSRPSSTQRVRVRGRACGVVHAALRPRRPGAARARARRSPASGAASTIYERTAAEAIEPGPRALRAAAACAPASVLRATEAFTVQQPRRAPALHAALLADDRDRAAARGRSGTSSAGTAARPISDLRHLFFYAQRTPDDRIAIGGRGAPYRLGSPIDESYERNDGVRARLDAHDRRALPGGREPRRSRTTGADRSACRATGAARCTTTRATGFGWAGGYTGHGVVTSNVLGRTLADLVLRRDTRPRLAAVGRPREPALGAGAAALPRLARDRGHARQRRPRRGPARPARPGARGSCGRSCRCAPG